MRLNALIGTVGISFSAVLVRLVDLPPAVTSFGRNAYALPMLVALALLLRRPSLRPLRPLGWLTGVVFGVNLYLWHSSIDLIGSGFATGAGAWSGLIMRWPPGPPSVTQPAMRRASRRSPWPQLSRDRLA